jgi:WD40 repeat protein/serine/threonine protein kinase
VDECPGRAELEAFLSDSLPPERDGLVLAHLEGCPVCQQVLEGLTTTAGPGGAASRGDADRLDPAPRRIGQYTLVRELGRGGMGVVYLAEQAGLKRPVALKVIRHGVHASAEEVARFCAEAEAVARLQHPNIVQIHEVGSQAGVNYLALEYVAGGNLDRQLAGTPQEPHAAARLTEMLARAVHHAHQRGILHRDLKPANILLQMGNGELGMGNEESLPGASSFPIRHSHFPIPKITDFGLAKRLEGEEALTQSGMILGTPSYMAPEQASGKRGPPTPAVDVYGLGALLYQMLTGRPPFQGSTPLSTLEQVASQEPLAPRKFQRHVPADLETICLKCLEKEPRRRYSSAEALADDLRRFLDGRPILARPIRPWGRAWKWARRRPVDATLASAVVLVAVLGLAGILWQWRGAVASRAVADRERDAAQAERDRALWQSYRANIGAATTARQLDDGTSARRSLEEVPEAWRRWWEWRHLHSRLDESAAVYRKPAGGQLLLAASDVGIRLASCGPDGVRLEDPDGGKGLALPGGGRWIHLVGHTARSTRVVAREESGHLVVWDETGRVRRRLEPPPGHSPWSVALSPDHTRLLVDWGEDRPRSFALYDLASGGKRAVAQGHTEYVSALAFSPDGKQFASASDDTSVRRWDTATGKPLRVLRGHTATVWSVAYRPDGARLVTASADGTVCQWDVTTGRRLGTPYRGHHNVARTAAYSPDGRLIASAGHDGCVRLWRAEDQEEVAVLHGHTEVVFQLAFSPDGRRLASASMDGTARLWEVAGPSPVLLRDHTSYVYPVAYSPDGAWIASGSWDDTVRLWDARTGLPALVLRHANRVRALAFSPDNTWLVSGCDDDDRLTVWDLASGQARQKLPGPGTTLAALAVSPDGATIASQDLDGSLRVTDLASGRAVFATRLSGRNAYARGELRGTLAYSPDGRWLALVADRSTVALWDTQTHEPAARCSGHVGAVYSLAFSPDGRRLVSAGQDRTVRIWDVATGAPLGEPLRGHTDEVLTAVFDPTGKRVASGGRDRAVLLWDVATGTEVARLHGHTNYVFSLAFSREGTTLASGSGDATVRLWDTVPLAERLKARREARAQRPGAERLVARLLQEGKGPSDVLRSVRADPALGEAFRREAQAALWRRLAGTDGAGRVPE